MRLPLLSLLGFCVVLPGLQAQTAGVPVGQSEYALVQADTGKTVGSAEATVTTVPGGYQIDSRGQLRMTKLTYSFANQNRLDPQLNIVRDQITGSVNGSTVTFNMASDSTGRTFQVTIVANGKTTNNSFDRHQRNVLLPDMDPAAYIEMAHLALGHPPTAWAVIPKQNGVLVPANYEPQPDAHGIFNGRSILVHHTRVVVSAENGISVEIYYGGDGTVYEADLPEQNFYVIRNGFHLQNRPQYRPPHGTAPPSGQQQQQQGSAQQPQ